MRSPHRFLRLCCSTDAAQPNNRACFPGFSLTVLSLGSETRPVTVIVCFTTGTRHLETEMLCVLQQRYCVCVCRYNPLGPEGVKSVADVVKYDLPLKKLQLGWCKVGAREGADHVGQMLQFNETLEVRPACLVLARCCGSVKR